MAFLGLLDAVHPAEMKGDLESEYGPEISVLRFLTGGRADASEDALAGLGERERMEWILDRARSAGTGLPPGLDAESLGRLVAVLRANRRALATYRPEPHSGRAVFLRAEELPTGRTVPPDAAWRPLLAGGLETAAVPGAHLTMHFPPHVATLARKLQEAVDAALADEATEVGPGPVGPGGSGGGVTAAG